MSFKSLLSAIISTVALASTAQAAQFDFSGNIANRNDVVLIDFSLASDANNVSVWTDSFHNGANFDPITAVWRQTGSDWTLVGQNDDNSSIAPGQTYWDSGLSFSTLAAGAYRFSIAVFSNFAPGPLLSNGFAWDNTNPSPLTTGTFYSVHLSGVDSAGQVSAVPEPETYAMMLAGLGLVGTIVRRRKSQQA